jgi:hypothetical protein
VARFTQRIGDGAGTSDKNISIRIAITRKRGESRTEPPANFAASTGSEILQSRSEVHWVLCNGNPISSQGDQIQARAISKAFCWIGDNAVVDSFIAYCQEEARALIAAHRAAVLSVRKN